MKRVRAGMLILMVGGLAGSALGAAPATPSYIGVEQAIGTIRANWARSAATPDPNAPGWNNFFDALAADLKGYAAAKTEDDRLRSLDRVYRMWWSLNSVSWTPVNEVRESLRAWLQPRVALAWALRGLSTSVRALPATGDAAAQANRGRWIQFVDDELGTALRDYEGAPDVTTRLRALGRLNAAIGNLQKSNRAYAWSPSLGLEGSLSALFFQPNIETTADVNTVRSQLDKPVAVSGPIYRKGLVSYATAGPKVGFGLMSSDDGVAFYNQQWISSVTPITTFQGQIEQDPKGRRAAKLYHFDATSTDTSLLSVVGVFRPSGLSLQPASTHNSDALVTSTPQPGKGLARGIASLIGLNQPKITQKVYEGAIGQVRSSIVTESADEAQKRSAAQAAQINARLASYLIGNNTLALGTFALTQLDLRSRPEYVWVRGLMVWRGGQGQRGADAPQPSHLNTVEGGITADIHIGSLSSNLARGYIESPAAQRVTNLMIVTKKVPPGAPPREGIETVENVDYPTFLRRVNEARAANDPKVMAVRIKRPGVGPEFAADRNGLLVAVVHDFAIEVPAPPAAARGGVAGPPAQIYRLEAPNAEFSISFKVDKSGPNGQLHFQGRIEAFDPGPGARVFALDQDEAKAAELSRFSASLVLSVFGNRLRGQPIDMPIPTNALRGFDIQSVSPLDPSGWMRIVLRKTAGTAPAAPATAVTPVASGTVATTVAPVAR